MPKRIRKRIPAKAYGKNLNTWVGHAADLTYMLESEAFSKCEHPMLIGDKCPLCGKNIHRTKT